MTDFTPSLGRIVEYTLSEGDAQLVNRRRKQACAVDVLGDSTTGGPIHSGNTVAAGEVFPLVITRVWSPSAGGAVNGQVLLDGNDTFWATSVTFGDGERHYRPFPRI